MIDSYQEVAARLRRGVVTGSTIDGRIRVREEYGERVFTCDTLRLVAGPRLSYTIGTEVLLLASDDDDEIGYVLGALDGSGADTSASPSIAVARDDDATVIRLSARQLLELTCGRASLIMNADGTVVLKGTTVVSRASGVNKIRGAAVRIN